MRKILILTNNIGGLFSFRKEVIQALVAKGYDVHISYPDNDARAEYFVKIGCHLLLTPFNLKGTNPFSDIKLVYKYVHTIKRIRPLAVLTYTIKPNIYGGIASSLCGVPHISNITGLGTSIDNNGLLSKIAIFLYRIGLRKSNRVFFQNEANKQFSIKNKICTFEQSYLIPGSGVNLEYHSLKDYPENNGQIKFLFIARLNKDKGTDEFLEMASAIKQKHSNVEFQILGPCEDNYIDRLREMGDAGIINYLGTTTDVRPFIEKVHCTVLPSYHEGLSNVNLESAAAGRPVITTDVPGCRETVDDSVTGFIVKPRNVPDLIEKIEKFINMPYDEKLKMGLKGRDKVLREYDRNIVINAYLGVIESLENTL